MKQTKKAVAKKVVLKLTPAHREAIKKLVESITADLLKQVAEASKNTKGA